MMLLLWNHQKGLHAAKVFLNHLLSPIYIPGHCPTFVAVVYVHIIAGGSSRCSWGWHQKSRLCVDA